LEVSNAQRFCSRAFRFLALLSVLASCSEIRSQVISKPSGSPFKKEEILSEKLKLDQQVQEAEKALASVPARAANAYQYGRAIENVVRFTKERVLWERKSRRTPGFKSSERQKFYNQAEIDYRKSQDLLQKAINVYTSIDLAKTLAVASDKIEMAWFLLNPVGWLRDFEVEKNLRESEKLYLDALALQDELAGRDADLTLETILVICDFYKTNADYDKSLELYERYVESVERRHGPDHKSLIVPLREMGKIAAMTERQKDADELAIRVSRITGRTETFLPEYPDLINRATDLSRVDLGNIRYHDRNMVGGLTGLGSIEERGAPVIVGQLAKQIIVKILVDETGNVIEAKLIGETKKGPIILNAARTTKFRPFLYKGTALRMLGRMVYNIVE